MKVQTQSHMQESRKEKCASDKARTLLRLLILALALVVTAVFHSCTNPTSGPGDDRSELSRFMELSQDIEELFEFNIYSRDTFILDSGDVTFRIAKIDNKVQGGNRVSPKNKTITSNFGITHYATVLREDNYHGIYTQQNSPNATTVESFYDARLSRRALFLKIGSDADPFLGWELIGLDLGKPLPIVSEFVTITNFPAVGGFPAILSDVPQETDLPVGDLRKFSYLFRIKSVKASDSIAIRTKRGPMTIFAHTNVGFRQLAAKHGAGDPADVFHYGFRAPAADPQNHFYHLLTFQQGPEEVIDSTSYNVFLLRVEISPIIPPDTQVIRISVPDTIFTFPDSFIFIDSCADPDSVLPETVQLDTCFVTIPAIDTQLNGSRDSFYTIINTLDSTSIFDSTLLPPDTFPLFEDLWVFPYSVR